MKSLIRRDIIPLSLKPSSTFIISQVVLFLMLISFIFPSAGQSAFISDQPRRGPGGRGYTHSKVVRSRYGLGAQEYYLFEPDGPKPDIAPLIVFLHGNTAYYPTSYGAWIEHIVKKGNIVIFPVYQSRTSASEDNLPNVLQSIIEAIDELQKQDHVEPDLDKFALVGHSLGGLLSANIAALARESGLPVPKAIMAVEPGLTTPLEDLSRISSETLLLTVVGDQDNTVGDKIAKEIFWGTPQIPLENKNFIIMVSDYHGISSLTADHYAPVCIPYLGGMISQFGVNALDYYGFWKLFDALTDAAFYQINREYALGNTPQQRYMGKWTDGTPRQELMVIDNP